MDSFDSSPIRHDWRSSEIAGLFELPFADLVFRAQTVHRAHFDANQVQMSSLLSIKTGGCPEDCKYCPQAARYDTTVEAEKLMDVTAVVAAAKRAKDKGATRYCLGAAWREPKDRDLDALCSMISGVKSLGLETCATLGMLSVDQARALKAAGLDYYNHNIDTSEAFYGRIITTRTFGDRLDTLEIVREAGMNVCCGGILGIGETREDRVSMLKTLATMKKHPESVPLNLLVRVEGTPLAGEEDFEPLEFVRTVAVARILMPASHVRLSAGRENMSDELQALCFLAGANSIFAGETLLTTPNPEVEADSALFRSLGIRPEPLSPEVP